MYSHNYSNNGQKVAIPFSTNWQELAFFIIQNKDALDWKDLN